MPFATASLSVHLIVAANIKQDDFLFGNHQGQGNPVTISETDGITSGKLAAQGVQLQTRLEWIFLQVAEYFGKAWPQVGMFLEKFARLTNKLQRRNDDIHLGASKNSEFAQMQGAEKISQRRIWIICKQEIFSATQQLE
jgi:hypothetical protein